MRDSQPQQRPQTTTTTTTTITNNKTFTNLHFAQQSQSAILFYEFRSGGIQRVAVEGEMGELR